MGMEGPLTLENLVIFMILPLVVTSRVENGYVVIQTGQLPSKSCALYEFPVVGTSSARIQCGIECNKLNHCIGMDVIESDVNVCRLLSGFSALIPANSSNNHCSRYQKSNGIAKGTDYYCSVPVNNERNVSTLCHQDSYTWTIIQRRFDGSVNFKQNWATYETGFGSRDSEFWIGNENIHLLTTKGYTHLKIELMDHTCAWKHAEYNVFHLDDASQKYRLDVSGYSGNAGDSLLYHDNMLFSTYDADNDQNGFYNCALGRLGGWWYNSCHKSNLNGEYSNTDNSNGINWHAWMGFEYSMTEVRMMLRNPTL
ncbi:ficolin-2-like [Ostrea edulis]|uniref:ficolin-2-like n=1 Tax=Ostrea edulis TaxID=37623 RepID=UPI0024AF57B1|nr:ficolin-2-like [Ostrea edulis]